jgi:lysophospholipase L1-like esterase
MATDLGRLASRYGFALVDVNHALRSADFGDYADGSPDGLHYRARGHALVADSVAERILLLPPPK